VTAYFLDASALVKRYARETGTAWTLGLFRRAAGHRLYVARITGVEVAAALARNHRGAHLTADGATRALARLRRDLGKRLRVVEITPALLTDAMDLAQKHALRGYDAVQLAALMEANKERLGQGLPSLTLVAADGELLAAGGVEGLVTDDPNNHP
jgi:predicted nucleic acid-binding protein